MVVRRQGGWYLVDLALVDLALVDLTTPGDMKVLDMHNKSHNLPLILGLNLNCVCILTGV